MSEEAKKLLLRLKKEKKTTKQIDLIEQLKPYNQEEIVNQVLLVHLERKDNDAIRLEILVALNYEDEAIVKPLSKIVNDSKELQSVKQKAIDLLRGEINAYDDYLTGNVYGYTIEPTDKNKSIECDDSCWGFYGDHENSGLLESAKGSIDYAIEKYKENCKAEHERRKQVNQFMQSSWAY